MARKLLLLGAAVIAAGVFLKRDKVAGLLPSRAETYTPPSPGPSNYDAPARWPTPPRRCPFPRPTSPRPSTRPPRRRPPRPRPPTSAARSATTADRPTSRPPRPSARWPRPARASPRGSSRPSSTSSTPPSPREGMSPAEHQIEDTIEQAGNPLAGEQVEGAGGWTPPTTPQEPAPFETEAEPEAESPAEPEPERRRRVRGEEGRRRRLGLADLVRPVGQPIAPPTTWASGRPCA